MTEANWVELAYARADPRIVYALNGKHLHRSMDSGRTFERRSEILGDDLSVSSNILWAGDPTDPNVVILGSLRLFRSTDGGRTLSRIDAFSGAAGQRQINPLTVAAGPRYDGRVDSTVFVGTCQGVYRIDDIRTARPKAWIPLNRGYGATQVLGVAGHPAGGALIAGTLYGGTLRLTARGKELAWTTLSENLGGLCAADPTDPEVLYFESSLHIRRSLDGGMTVTEIAREIADVGRRESACPLPAGPERPEHDARGRRQPLAVAQRQGTVPEVVPDQGALGDRLVLVPQRHRHAARRPGYDLGRPDRRPDI